MTQSDKYASCRPTSDHNDHIGRLLRLVDTPHAVGSPSSINHTTGQPQGYSTVPQLPHCTARPHTGTLLRQVLPVTVQAIQWQWVLVQWALVQCVCLYITVCLYHIWVCVCVSLSVTVQSVGSSFPIFISVFVFSSHFLYLFLSISPFSSLLPQSLCVSMPLSLSSLSLSVSPCTHVTGINCGAVFPARLLLYYYTTTWGLFMLRPPGGAAGA